MRASATLRNPYLLSLFALFAGAIAFASMVLITGGSTSGAPIGDTVVTIGAREAANGGVTVVVNRVEQTPDGLTISYTASSNSKFLGEITPPRLVDASGKALRPAARSDTRAVDQSSGAATFDGKIAFRSVPAGEYKLVFGPFLMFSRTGPNSIEIPASIFRETERIAGRAGQPAVKTLIPFQANGGQYAVTEIELASGFTGFYFEPQDAAAARVLPLGTAAMPILTDNTGREYRPRYRTAKFGPVVNGRMDVDRQYMRYIGAPGPEAETLTLVLGGYDAVVEGEWKFPVTIEEKR
ncbi:MAG: hypothetical protein HY681_01820 [Chloroflexi bacterium]|nr:hypothetical protein [Chloroflexota bacterium]